MNPTNSPDAVVIDANVLIAICAREATKLSQAETVINEYAINGVLFYAPGALIASNSQFGNWSRQCNLVAWSKNTCNCNKS